MLRIVEKKEKRVGAWKIYCAVCGAEFIAKRFSAMFDKQSCRKKANRIYLATGLDPPRHVASLAKPAKVYIPAKKLTTN